MTEIVPLGHGFYDYDAKYAEGGSKHVLPAPVKPFVYQNIRTLAVDAHRAIGCRGVSRSDFRYDEAGTGEVIWLEVNTQPGMTRTSLVPELAAHAGHELSGAGGLDGGGRVVPAMSEARIAGATFDRRPRPCARPPPASARQPPAAPAPPRRREARAAAHAPDRPDRGARLSRRHHPLRARRRRPDRPARRLAPRRRSASASRT